MLLRNVSPSAIDSICPAQRSQCRLGDQVVVLIHLRGALPILVQRADNQYQREARRRRSRRTYRLAGCGTTQSAFPRGQDVGFWHRVRGTTRL